MLYGELIVAYTTLDGSRPASLAAYPLVASICSGCRAAIRFRITLATLGMSSANFASAWAIEATISSWYGVSCRPLAAAAKPVDRSCSTNLLIIWFSTSATLEPGSMVYVAGNRKPSTEDGEAVPTP